MSLAWADVLDTLLREVETWPERAGLQKICVVRDLRGRIRLAVQGKPADMRTLEDLIQEKLGAWFAGPILWTEAPSQEQRRLANNLVTKLQSRWPASWPGEWTDVTGARRPITRGLWCGEQRARTKDTWLHEGPVSPPWPLHAKTPAVVSFYSFKGGVGRTTTLGVVARRLARMGYHVVAMDLDLEAPGLGRFFDVGTERGILDLLATHAATGTTGMDDPGLYCKTLDEGSGTITVYPVGAMDWSYVERLACLDYAPRGNAEPSAVETALRAVLEEIRRQRQPDYILLDARAGLHDLGGLSLHALAHVDVLVGRAGQVTLDGFRLVLEALARRRKLEDLRVVMVQSFVPLPTTGDEYARIRDNWADDLHDVFTPTLYKSIYGEDEDLPEVSDREAMHSPWVIPQYDSIERVERIQDIDRTVLDGEPFAELSARIIERCGRSLLPDMDETDEESGDGSQVTE